MTKRQEHEIIFKKYYKAKNDVEYDIRNKDKLKLDNTYHYDHGKLDVLESLINELGLINEYQEWLCSL